LKSDATIIAPVYSQIALDIALRIERGELKENTKIYGRSIMASEYGVSPETIRRAMALLEDTGVVEIRQNSGSVIISAEKARAYVKKFGERNEVRTYKQKLKELLAQQDSLSRSISETAGMLVRVNERFSQTTPFPNYETDVPNDSSVIGRTLGELRFWQQTSATVIAIRRKDQIILSPGPYAALMAGDTLIYIGDIKCPDAVNAFVQG
jgi:K+/H+ antiporter YhaU regulatory subunit KhtT